MNMAAQPKPASLTAERLRQLVRYDPETGAFTRLSTGKTVGSCNGQGYLVFSVDGGSQRAHRLAWLYMHGKWPAETIDHINGNRVDNRIANLRDISNHVNQENVTRPNLQNKSGVLGVVEQEGRFRPFIKVNNKTRALGSFSTPEAAHEAYLKAKRQLHKGCTI